MGKHTVGCKSFLVALLVTLLYTGSPASAQKMDVPPPGASATDAVTEIIFGATLPDSVFRTFTAPEGGADVDIFARDCCIRDDVVEIYVDGCRLATVDSRSGAFGTHPGETHTVSVGKGTHTVEYRNTVSSVGASGWEVSETIKAFTGNFLCCGGAGVTEAITGFPPCGPAGALSPKWGQFGSKAVLEADSGEKLQLDCVAGGVNWYRLSYTPPGGISTRVGVCPFEAGCNSAAFVHGGDRDKNGKPDCFLRTRWISRDYGKNDDPNPWTGEAGEGFLDWAESAFDAKTQNLIKSDYQYIYAVGPPVVGCLPAVKAEGALHNTIIVDPPIGPETEAFFDEVIGRLQLLPSGNPMAGPDALLCDLNGDGTCSAADFQELSNALGACRGDQQYLPTADADLDGCIGPADQSVLFDALIDVKPDSFPNSINPKNRGVIPVAVLSTAFGVPVGSIDPGTARFGSTGTEAAPAHHALEDVNGDGDLDLILHFRTQETGIACGDTIAYLRAKTTDGKEVSGMDSIRTVSCK